MGFDLSKYETVKKRKKRFYGDHADGRIIEELVSPVQEASKYVVFKVQIYLGEILVSTGHAYEERETELSISGNGKSYASVNYSSWLENCSESAVGRALDNFGYAGNDQCSKEEMQRVARVQNTFQAPTVVSDPEPEPVLEEPTVEEITPDVIAPTPTFKAPTTVAPVETQAVDVPKAAPVFKAPPKTEMKVSFKAPNFKTKTAATTDTSTTTTSFDKYRTKKE